MLSVAWMLLCLYEVISWTVHILYSVLVDRLLMCFRYFFGHSMIVLWTPAIFWVHRRPLLHNLITLMFKKVSKTNLQILFPIQPKIIYWQYMLQISCLQFSWGHYEQGKIVLRLYKLSCLSKSSPIIPVSWKYLKIVGSPVLLEFLVWIF